MAYIRYVDMLSLTFERDPYCIEGGYEFFDAAPSVHSHLQYYELILTPKLDKAGDKICIFGFSRDAYTARWVIFLNRI